MQAQFLLALLLPFFFRLLLHGNPTSNHHHAPRRNLQSGPYYHNLDLSLRSIALTRSPRLFASLRFPLPTMPSLFVLVSSFIGTSTMLIFAMPHLLFDNLKHVVQVIGVNQCPCELAQLWV